MNCRLAYVEGSRKEIEERINEILSESNQTLHTFHPMVSMVKENYYRGLVAFIWNPIVKVGVIKAGSQEDK